MKLSFVLCLLFILTSGCTAKYAYIDVQKPVSMLDPSANVLVLSSENGWHGNELYRDSGVVIALEVHRAILKNVTGKAGVVNCTQYTCINNREREFYRYYVQPEILQWEDRATQLNFRPDRIRIRIIVYDMVTNKELASILFAARSKIFAIGRDYPPALLRKPVSDFVKTLYPNQ